MKMSTAKNDNTNANATSNNSSRYNNKKQQTLTV